MKNKSQKTVATQWSMIDLYDMLMFEIEPELLSDAVGELDELYKNETKEEHQERMDRYKVAFQTFSDRFGKMLDLWKVQLKDFDKAILSAIKAKAGAEESGRLSGIEQSLDNI
jgi:hypothetical protein